MTSTSTSESAPASTPPTPRLLLATSTLTTLTTALQHLQLLIHTRLPLPSVPPSENWSYGATMRRAAAQFVAAQLAMVVEELLLVGVELVELREVLAEREEREMWERARVVEGEVWRLVGEVEVEVEGGEVEVVGEVVIEFGV